MKRAWTRFWASVSFLSLATAGGTAQTKTPRRPAAATRASESRLAGLAPGQTRLTRAEAVLGKPRERDKESGSARWNRCGQDLLVEADAAGRIETIRVTGHAGRKPSESCQAAATRWATGRGLGLGDTVARALELYGRPDSRSPSTKGGQRLELLYYAFDWAGPDVPQVMEVVCTVGMEGEPGRVVEITLAASSL